MIRRCLKISEIFDLTGLTDTIELAPSIDDAIKKYAHDTLMRCYHAIRYSAY